MPGMNNALVLLDGKKVAQTILDQCAQRVARIKQMAGITPCLATVLVGEDPSSVTYVRMKGKRCEDVGMRSLRVEMPASTSTEQLVQKISSLSADPAVSGILLQHPVPRQIDERAAFEAIAPIKDVDGVTIHSFGAMGLGDYHGDGPRFGPWGSVPGSATPGGIMRLLEAYNVPLAGKHAVVIGRSAILGKPMAMMLLGAHATVTICHSRTQNLGQVVRQGDIVVAAVGKPRFVKGDWIKPGAIVIDAGYHSAEKCGDVDYEPAAAQAAMITPVPGGVGPMTIATLIDQTSLAAAWQLKLKI
jgi:methylenetetrahydrofolate dehydrogenase (NADP+)/methenyltetrahydrofolate cyclohydrolase